MTDGLISGVEMKFNNKQLNYGEVIIIVQIKVIKSEVIN